MFAALLCLRIQYLSNATDVVNALVTLADAAAGRLELDARERPSGRHIIIRG